MSLTTLLAILVVVVALPLNVYVTRKLRRLSQSTPEIKVLHERSVAALALTLIVAIYAAVFVNNEIHPPPLDFESTKLITRGALLALAVIPAARWAWLYRKA